MCVRVYVCVWVLQMITRDWVWLITGLRGTEVCVYTRVFVLCVYRHASAGLSIHVNMSKTPEGAACAAQKKIRNWMKWLMYKKNFHSNQVKAFKLNTPVQKHTHTHTHALQQNDMTYQAMHDFFFCLACKKPPDGKMQKRGVSKKQKYDQLDFFFPLLFKFFFTISSSCSKWNPIRSKKQILRRLSSAFSFVFTCMISPDIAIHQISFCEN